MNTATGQVVLRSPWNNFAGCSLLELLDDKALERGGGERKVAGNHK